MVMVVILRMYNERMSAVSLHDDVRRNERREWIEYWAICTIGDEGGIEDQIKQVQQQQKTM